MKTLSVFYTAEWTENRRTEQRKTHMEIQVTDLVAEVLLHSMKAAEKLGLQMQIINILEASEQLKGRRYVPGSITHFREGGAAHDGQGDGDSEKRADGAPDEK